MFPFSGAGYRPLKRLMDICGSVTALALFSPLMLYVAYKVKNNLGSPVLFKQARPGRGEKPFMNYKFRSMRDIYDADGKPLPDSERLTPFGEFLRSSSLDELPELWNVLRGEMSLVGPRPLLVSFLPLFSEEEARRHSVKPGITGWAQVNGRNEMTWRKRNEYDLWYVEHMSFPLDMKILWMTVRAVFNRSGINSGADKTIITPPTEIKRPCILEKIGYKK